MELCSRIKIVINYETSKTAAALQWLTPLQTLGKLYPYMFSQCQVCRVIFTHFSFNCNHLFRQ